MNNLVFFATAASTTAGGSIFDSLGFIAFVLGALALLYSYQLTRDKTGLEAQISREKAILGKLKTEVQNYKQQLEKIRREEQDKLDSRVPQELERTKAVATAKLTSDGLRKEYWDRLGQMTSVETGNPELKRLMDEKAEIEGMIELTKAKYHTRAIDEKSFSNITEEYQKKLIEIETKIVKEKNRLKKLEEPTSGE